MSLSGIEGKVALVTGAARRRGIGRATALRLAQDGADVACLDIARPYESFPGHGVATADELEEVVAEIEGLGGRGGAVPGGGVGWGQGKAARGEGAGGLGRLAL